MEFDSPQEALFFAIGFIDHPGVNGDFEQQIKDSINHGADLSECNEDGETPLTYSILSGMGSPRAVKVLLDSGADPDLRDQNGWTPWAAYVSRAGDRVVEEEMAKIKLLLEGVGVNTSDEQYFALLSAIENNDVSTVSQMIEDGIDLHQQIINPLMSAVMSNNIDITSMLIDAGVDIEQRDDDESETALIYAASNGNSTMVELLVERGANINAYAWGDLDWNAERVAREEGYIKLADYILEKSNTASQLPLVSDKFKVLLDNHTDGINVGLNTADIISHLEAWDKAWGISISEVAHDRLVVAFNKLPQNLGALAKDIYEFCPDVIDQGFGCLHDMIEMMEETGQEVTAELEESIKGIDFSDENYGLVLLERDLAETKSVSLWWD